VIIFGLLSWGATHRQAQALAESQNVLEAWYMHSTKIHREAKASRNLVPDPFAWVSAQVKDEVGQPLEVAGITRVVAELRSIELSSADGRRVVVSPLTAAQLRRAQRSKKGIRTFADAPLLNGNRGVVTVERSLMNSDYFDLEAAQAGTKLTVPGWDSLPRLYFHILPAYQ
jgi:hypothetical protein